MARNVVVARTSRYYYLRRPVHWEWAGRSQSQAVAGLNIEQKIRRARQRTPVCLRPKGSPSRSLRNPRHLYSDPQMLSLKMMAPFEAAGAAGASLLSY